MLKATIALLAALSILAVVGLASADNPHLNSSSPTTFTDNGLTLTAAGQVYGLGNGGTVFLSATANATATCTNPSGKSKPPGQNPAPTTVSGGVALPDANGTNGSRPFSVTTTAPASPISPTSTDFSCPNSSWTETITDLKFTSATLTATTPSSATVYALASCSFITPTTNGPVPASNITC